jgi:drug/metabolite transporter superfamily protein YnfA
MLAGAFHAIPALGILSLVGMYGLYLLYVGIQPMMKTSDDKITAYFVVSLLVIIAIYAILTTILAMAFIGRNYSAIPVMQ